MQEENIIDNYTILLEGAEAEIVEKKSRFIATIVPVNSEEEAVAFIEKMKKKYYDARHNCSAFIIGSRGELLRSSDDGEPQGTAGKPMLEVLSGSGIKNIAVVVTRYFGGTLLGTGGLVRAYSSAVKEALALCKTAENHYGVTFEIQTDYNGVGKIQYLLAKRNVETLQSDYGVDVKMTVRVPVEEYDVLVNEITEATNARACITEIERAYYLMKNE